MAILFLFLTWVQAAGPATSTRAMNFMDVLSIRSVGDPAISPDGKWLLYTLSVPNWTDAKSYTDIYLSSVERGAPDTRQLTFTRDKNETLPRWSRDGRQFVFMSNRDGIESQLYVMRTDGGEASQLTDTKDGVTAFAFSRDGRWLAFSAGKDAGHQIWIMPLNDLRPGSAIKLTNHETPVTSWQFSPDSRRVYFLAGENWDSDNHERVQKKFDVKVRNEPTPLIHLWAADLESRSETRLTSGSSYSVSSVTVSPDSKWIGFRGTPADRYLRNILETDIYADSFLMNVESGDIERLTRNDEIGESAIRFSPDSTLLAFAADDDFTYFRNNRIWIRAIKEKGGQLRKLGADFDGDLNVSFWAPDGKTIYSNSGVRATNQVLAVSVESGKTVQVTRESASLSAQFDEESRTVLLNYSDPKLPRNYFATALTGLGSRPGWRQLTDSNPQVRGIDLGETEAIQWKSTDGRVVEGVLVRPVGYQPGRRYPLIVQIHGGPAGADVLGFIGTHGNYSHVYAGNGYAVLMPNYRGSTNYGEKHKMEIGGSGNYFQLGYDDIMTGVDHLISIGLVDPERMGVMGWSAGGHWSNWILTHTNRFKAVSSGAGAVNWTSMYAQSDSQRIREFYFGGKPYDDFDHLWDISPLKYIKNARTPTLIHVVDGDPRVPRPQSEELHMALKKLGVPTEFFVYPGFTHGITEPRNQLVKMVSEFGWMEKWVRGKDTWFEWKQLLETLREEKREEGIDPKKTNGGR